MVFDQYLRSPTDQKKSRRSYTVLSIHTYFTSEGKPNIEAEDASNMVEYREVTMTVLPQIGLLNRYAQQAKKVAITAINPVFNGAEAETQRRALQALRIQVEGPSKHLSYFNRLVERANLLI